MVAYFLNPAQVAFFVIAERLAEHIMYIPQSLGVALFPRLTSSDDARIHAMTARACRQTLVVTGLIAATLALTGRFLIVLWYGADYAEAAGPLPYVALGIVMMSMYVLLSRNFTSRNRQQINIIAGYTALGGNLALNVFLIPAYGIVGAAMSAALSYSAAAIILLVFFLKESGLSWHEPLLLKRSDLLMWRRLGREALDSLRGARV
jgi:O-antigen/teichoic acid export membrane protein